MPTSQGTLAPFVSMNRSVQLHNTVSYPVGGNVTSSTNAVFVATWGIPEGVNPGVNVIDVVYMRSGRIVPGMALSGIGIPAGTVIVGPLDQNGSGDGRLGTYTISKMTTAPSNSSKVVQSEEVGTVVSGTATPSTSPTGPDNVVGSVPGFNSVNIMDLRDY